MIGNIVAGLYARGPVPFTPLDIPDLKAWYDAADTGSISISGSAVTQWNDKSGNNYHLSQATGTKQPQSGTTTLNGKNVITFDGGDRLVASTAADWKFLHDGTNFLIGYVIKFSSSSNPNSVLIALATASIDDSTLIGFGSGIDDRSVVPFNNNLRTSVSRGVAGTWASFSEFDNAIANVDSPQFITYLGDPDNGTAADRMAVFIGNGTASKTNTSTNTPSTSNPTYALNVGWSGGEAYGGITGYVAEVVIVGGATGATESYRVQLKDYLKEKWAL